MFKGSVALEGFSSLGIDPRPMVDQIWNLFLRMRPVAAE
jgi:hypothetical protein